MSIWSIIVVSIQGIISDTGSLDINEAQKRVIIGYRCEYKIIINNSTRQ